MHSSFGLYYASTYTTHGLALKLRLILRMGFGIGTGLRTGHSEVELVEVAMPFVQVSQVELSAVCDAYDSEVSDSGLGYSKSLGLGLGLGLGYSKT